MSRRKWIDPQDFRDLRRESGLTRVQVAEELNVTPRTVQNWETGGARIPWMAYRMLRILRGYALPGFAWEGWTLRNHQLFSPAGRSFEASNLAYLDHVFGMARLWRQMYSRSGRAKTASTVVDFPEQRKVSPEHQQPPQGTLKRLGGTR